MQSSMSSIAQEKILSKTYLNKNNMKVMSTAEEIDVFVLFLVVPAWSEILLLFFFSIASRLDKQNSLIFIPQNPISTYHE